MRRGLAELQAPARKLDAEPRFTRLRLDDVQRPAHLLHEPATDREAETVSGNAARPGVESIDVADVAGGTPARIAAGEAPAWSPDGSELAFTDSRTR